MTTPLLQFAYMTLGCTALHICFVHAMLACSTRVRALQRVQPGRPYYVAANLVKAVCLAACACTPSWRDLAWRGLLQPHFFSTATRPADGDGAVLQFFVALYAATDLSQFVTVRMARSTQAHHAATSLFAAYICMRPPMEQAPLPPLAIALLWYGFCSVLACAVNAYLALHVLFGPETRGMDALRQCAAATYAASLCVNWPVHTHMVATASSSCHAVVLWLYLGVTAVLMVDDIKLLRHLCRPLSPPEVVRALQDASASSSASSAWPCWAPPTALARGCWSRNK